MQGIIADKEDKKPIAYATVVALDSFGSPTSKGVLTNEKGEFNLDSPYGLLVSYVGYADVKIEKPNATSIYYMQKDSTIIDTVTIVGEDKRMNITPIFIGVGIVSVLALAYMYFNKKD